MPMGEQIAMYLHIEYISRTSLTFFDEGTLALSSLMKSSVLRAFLHPVSIWSDWPAALSSRLELVEQLSLHLSIRSFFLAWFCFLKKSGSLKNLSKLPPRWNAVGEFGVDLDLANSSFNKFSVLLLRIRGGSWSRYTRLSLLSISPTNCPTFSSLFKFLFYVL